MSERERQVLEGELNDLKNILDFYIKYGNSITSMDQSQMSDHIDDILDRINEIKKLLEQ